MDSSTITFLFYKGFGWFVGIALIIGAVSGYFIGKKFGKGWGITSGIGISFLSLLALSNCHPCKKMIYNVTTNASTGSPEKPNK